MRINDTYRAIYHLLLADRRISSVEIGERLSELGFAEVPSVLLISSLRSRFLGILEFLEDAGLIEPDVHVALPRELRLKRRPHKLAARSRDRHPRE